MTSDKDLFNSPISTDEIQKTQVKAKSYGYNVVDIDTFEIETISAASVTPKQQPWLWDGVIPLHTSTLFAGYGGIGKSLLLLQLAADISRGKKINCCGLDYNLPEGKVIILTAEDDFEYQAKPKLIAAGANCENIYLLKSVKSKNTGKRKFIDLYEQLQVLDNLVKEIKDVKLIIIDPIAYFTGNLRDHINVDVCNFIDGLNQMAKENDLAIIFNKHLRKQSSGGNVGNAVNEVAGGGAWINSPRQSWLISVHPKEVEKVVLINLKTNINKKNQECLAYEIRETSIEVGNSEIKTTRLEWCPQTVTLNADEAMSRDSFEKSKEQIAVDFIMDYLEKYGDSVQSSLINTAKSKNIPKRTCERILQKLKNDKIIKHRKGIGNSPVLYLDD